MILNIRGTSGSGKTHLVRLLMEQLKSVKVLEGGYLTDPDKKPGILGYRGWHGTTGTVTVVGSYANVCGGCDTIKTQDEVVARVTKYARQGHVVFEGLLVGDIYARYAALARSFDTPSGAKQFRFLYLDTPLETCIARIIARRRDKGNLTELNPENTTTKWHNCRRQFARAEADGLQPEWVPWKDPLPVLLRYLA